LIRFFTRIPPTRSDIPAIAANNTFDPQVILATIHY